MSDKKISQLNELVAANVAPATDVLAIVDTNVTETKKITAKGLVDGALNTLSANGILYLDGSRESQVIEPRTGYLLSRVQKDYRSGKTTLQIDK